MNWSWWLKVKKIDQLEDNLATMGWSLTKDEIERFYYTKKSICLLNFISGWMLRLTFQLPIPMRWSIGWIREGGGCDWNWNWLLKCDVWIFLLFCEKINCLYIDIDWLTLIALYKLPSFVTFPYFKCGLGHNTFGFIANHIFPRKIKDFSEAPYFQREFP